MIIKIKIEKEKLYGLPPPFCKLANINVGKYFLKQDNIFVGI